MIFNLSCIELKQHYEDLFISSDAAETSIGFRGYLSGVVAELSVGLAVDLSAMDRDLSDETLLGLRSFGALDSLRRALLPLAEAANYKATAHPDWSLLAGRLEIQRLKLLVPETFKEMLDANVSVWRNDVDHSGVETLDYYSFASAHAAELESLIVPSRDYDLYFFGVRTLEKSYLMRLMVGGDQLLETPQRMYLRIATALWMPNIQTIKRYYDLMSAGYFTHASPTMFHAGIAKGSLASCFLLSMQDDLDKIFKCLSQCAQISKSAGGIGLDITNIRHSKVSHMGHSSGIVPMLQVYNAAMRYVDQCFYPDTIVYTRRGPMQIGNVCTGDEVFTRDGELAKVAKAIHYHFDENDEQKEVYDLSIEHAIEMVTVAGVHPILALRKEHVTGSLRDSSSRTKLTEKLESGKVVPEFIRISDLSVGDYTLTPIPAWENDHDEYTVDDCYIYGLFARTGEAIDDKFTLRLESSLDEVCEYLTLRTIPFTRKTTTIEWYSGPNFPFIPLQFEKRTIHHSLLHLPIEKTMALLRGLLYRQRSDDTGTHFLFEEELQILESVRYLLLRMGIAVTGDDCRLEIPKVAELLYGIDVDPINSGFIPHDYTIVRIDGVQHLLSQITKKELIKYNVQKSCALQVPDELRSSSTLVELEIDTTDERRMNYVTAIGCAHNGGRRKGSATIFLQPWHIDFPDFLLLKRQHGKEERRARDLFYAVWNCDLFMERVRADETWTLFCPKFVPMLKNTYGDEFNKWYLQYEKELALLPNRDNFMRRLPARELWNELLTTQIESGMPFMTNKDTANATSNQQNLGVIRSSNLCVEIVEVTDENTISSCNLASIALDEYVIRENGVPRYDHVALGDTVRLVIQGLNRVIDRTFYPLVNEHEPGPIKSTNLKYRPLGLGVQGLADTFLRMDLAWTDLEARELNKEIFATIYYHAVAESVELAKESGTYMGFYGSPASKGLLKPDLLAAERARKALRGAGIFFENPRYAEELKSKTAEILGATLSKRYDWVALRRQVVEYGLRNSLLVALMPTASSAQIRYKNESFEPFTTNMYVRSVLAGNHLIVNRYMVAELAKLGLWNKSVVNFIIKNEGSIATLPVELVSAEHRPTLERIKEKCKTAFELSQKLLVDMSIDRAAYVCQSQSLNIHIKDPSFKQMTSLHFYAWENGLTTGMYYLRTSPATEAIKFTVEGEVDVKKSLICTEEICVSCTA